MDEIERGTRSSAESGRRHVKEVVVTGATGLVGRFVSAALEQEGVRVRRVARRARPGVAALDLADSLDRADPHISGADALVHLAGRVHVMRDTSTDPLAEFRAQNTRATVELARVAARVGCRRFVFMSTIKVNGEGAEDRAYSEADDASPQDPYAVSKWEAEQGLRRLADETGLEVAVIRPPLVYGPGVEGNFRRLWDVAGRRLPLPFGSLNNRRSLVGVRNLATLVCSCVVQEAAAGELFVASDQDDVSTPELIRRMAEAQGRRARLIPVPRSLLRAAGLLALPRHTMDRLCGSLVVDSSKATRLLGWTPSVRMTEQMREIAQYDLGGTAP